MTAHARAYQTLRGEVDSIRAQVDELTEMTELDPITVHRLELMAELAAAIIASTGLLMQGLDEEIPA